MISLRNDIFADAKVRVQFYIIVNEENNIIKNIIYIMALFALPVKR